ncbi:hypothetical protein [Paenibacillus sp. 481]|uniref:hypothetical protein n=1 Tax=Paenibacillus sp. 481 TaxID=2835869 RepID=UPI001E3436AA|nr:hypothetical protein [Paenibacillus sp. 481]UHA74779.1 hypothetical protein KIK04_06885 [Paenibacillus sp. 481]
MSQLISKQEALQHFYETYVRDQWQYDFVVINERYSEQRESIEHGLISAFHDLCMQAYEQQEQGIKGDIHYMYISFLRTSMMQQSSTYRFDAYDEQWFLDRTECSKMWQADFIFDPLFRTIDHLERKKGDYARKVTSMDIEHMVQLEALKYHVLVVEFMKSMVPALLNCKGFQQMAKSTQLKLFVGEYRDQCELLHEYNESLEGADHGYE